MKPLEEFPAGPGALFDLLHQWYGFGYYDDAAANSKPWHSVRMGEISRLKALMKGRRATEKQVAIAGWYARETRQVITKPSDLFALIPVAMKTHNQLLKAAPTEDLEAAASEALELGETEWAERLIRANDRSTLDQWRNRG